MIPGSVVVVGGGQAGGRAIEALRTQGYQGRITLVGAEAHLPYERPSLSKEMLLDLDHERVEWVRPAAWYNDHGIECRLGTTVTAINRDARRIVLDDASEIGYGALILATGATPRLLPGANHDRVLAIRTIEDSQALRPHLTPGARIVVIGAGFIGLEVAAAASSHGCAVTVLEAAGRVMARGVPQRISQIYAKLHRDHGVDLRLHAGIGELSDAFIAADIVVVGIGVIPNDDLASACGLAVDNGILVDAHGRTSDPHIYAAGDVTRHYNPLLDRALRLESWQNAQNQAIAVARNILGENLEYAEVPWFWSDQYGINMQITGLTDPDAVTVERGSLDAHAGLLFELVAGKLVCAVGLNAARDLRVAKQIISLGKPVDAAALADPAVKLNDLYRTLKAG
jgi:NADPH-dependent 2,4-dienoyl-CoA reductase/sulfur reductase-like enzyme